MGNKLLAEQILSNKLFKNILSGIERQMFEQWIESESTMEREAIHIKIAAIRGLLAEINEHLVRTINE